jgi:hypothetical protein
MEKSTSIKEMAKALISFHVKMDTVKKDATNPFFKSKYASLSNILEAIQVPMEEAGIAFTQFPNGEHGLTTILMHGESGEYLQSDYIMHPAKNDPQGQGSALTYQRRYALSAILGLNIDDDDDANTATHGGKNPAEAVENNKPWLNENTKEFTGAVDKWKPGFSRISDLRTYFKITKAIEEKLLTAVKEKHEQPA